MNRFYSIICFILASFLFAIHEKWGLRELQSTFIWHITQWGSISLFVFSGFLFALWSRPEASGSGRSNYYYLGEFAGFGLGGGIIVYVATLHYLF